MTTKKLLNPNRSPLVTMLATLMGLSATLACTVIKPPSASTETAIADETQPESSEAAPKTQEETPNASTVDSTVTDAADETRSQEALASNPASANIPTAKQDSIEPTTIEMYLPEIERAKGASYTAVRSQLMEYGWIPHTFATNGPVGDTNDTRVQEMQELGFEEVKSCSGTGQGFCLLQFVHRDRLMNDGSVLVVITAASAPSGSPYLDPTFWDFRIDDVSDTTYVDRRFDRSLFNQLREEESFCLGVGRCEYIQYQLKDALLIGGSYDFGTTKTTLILRQPVSKEEAIAYAKILDAEGSIDFANAEVISENNTQSYTQQDVLPEGVIPGSYTMVKLVFTDSGKVSEISFSIFVL